MASGRDAEYDKKLSICLTAEGFSFAEISSRRELLAFGNASGGHSSLLIDATRDIKAFCAESGIRPLSFKHMELVVVSDESAWVPDEIYTPTANRQYLRLVGGKGISALATSCRQLSSTSVFVADEGLVTAFKVAMPGLTVNNQHVRFASLAPLSGNHPVMLAHWRKERVDLAAFRDGRYLYGNTLTFEEEKTALYQIVEVRRTFGIDDADTELLLCGDVDRERYARFRPYFPKTTLFTGTCSVGHVFRQLHTYRHAVLLS